MIDPEDRFEDHVADTLVAGGTLCDPEVVKRVICEAPRRIEELIAWGTRFDTAEGRLALGREGGHGHDRIVHALGDATGKEVMRAVTERARRLEHVEVWQETFTIDLLTLDGVCRGAIVWNQEHGKTLVWAKQTILATGGAGQIYRETTNPTVATGDGLALAYRAGAELRDVEFVQFHPTVLYIAGGSRSLISEATRGEGAHLVDRHGHRFMPDYDPRAELAPRDVVSLSIVSQMEKTRHPNVYLDMTHLDPQRVLSRFPGIAAICAEFDLDITRDRIPVRPGAHYMMGGITVDRDGRTTLPGLWAAGEVTSTGLHGANRLASNSLLEALVYGAHAGEGASCAALGHEGRLLRPADREPAGRFGRRAVEPGRHSQRLEEPDVAERRRPPRRRGPGRGPADGEALVPLRLGPAVQRSRRLGVAEHDLHCPLDDRGRPGTRRRAAGPTSAPTIPRRTKPAGIAIFVFSALERPSIIYPHRVGLLHGGGAGPILGGPS